MLEQRNGGAQIDMTGRGEYLHHRQFVPDFGIEPPPSKPSRFAGLIVRLVWLALGMAVTATIILAAMRP